jgi:aminopeptidase N
MKKLGLLFFLFSFVLYGQNSEKELNTIVNAEKKSAAKKMALVTNPNTYNYDIVYHRLRFKVDPAIQFIDGEVTTKYIAKEDINSVTFDLSNDLEVSTVKQRGVDLTFSRSTNNELIIDLPFTQNINVLDSLTINYSGVPPTSGFGSFITSQHNSTPVLWTLSEPFGAMEWWPCKQDLNDKIDAIDVYVTAPSVYISVSNGLEKSKVGNSDGTVTTHFHHGYPIPAYLIAVAVTNYSVYTQQAGASPNQFPIVNYLYPESLNDNLVNLNQTPQIMDFFESAFTPYPFRNEKYGHAQFGWGGGMEHTTVSFMGGFSRGLIAHELAHQWFGDKVTCGSWNDIWLNEGFATYLASMVIENFDGETAFVNDKSNMINFITSSTDGAVYLTDEEASNVNRIFNSRLSYSKGAMVLNMLRFKLGDAIFFQALKNYLNDPILAYNYAKTPDLQAHLEAVSGMNLTEFFNDWVYNQGYPSYSISVKNYVTGQVQITINQTQSHSSVSFFEMPVPIRLMGALGEQKDIVLENTANEQTFIVDVPFVVTDVVFDPKKEIISRNNNATLKVGNFDFKNENNSISKSRDKPSKLEFASRN